MIKRIIEEFDKKTEELKYTMDLVIPDEVLFRYYKNFLKDDPLLIYDYDITDNDVNFYRQYISMNFDFVNNDYMISLDGNYIRCNVYLKRAFDENIFFVERFEWK